VRASGADPDASSSAGRSARASVPRWARGASGPSRDTRESLTRRYGEAVVHLEFARSRAADNGHRGQIQYLLTELLAVRGRLENLPAHRLASLATLEHLEILEKAIDASLSAETEAVRTTCLDTAQEALRHIAAQAT